MKTQKGHVLHRDINIFKHVLGQFLHFILEHLQILINNAVNSISALHAQTRQLFLAEILQLTPLFRAKEYI